ncbi:MAG: serine--tRNA ligase, partial [Saprospiraceae bacterium]|nr:serine--tRNA ligase [Saprospiraceae bacterium]
MLEISYIRENHERVLQGLKVRNFSEEELEIVEKVLSLDDKRKNLQTELDNKLAERNSISKSIGDLFKQGKKDEANAMRQQVNDLKEKAGQIEEELKTTKSSLAETLVQLPNIPHPSVPAGNTDEDNEVAKDWTGALPELGENAKPHWELASQYNIFDLELGVKIAGSGFPVFRGKGARLVRALIAFFLDEAARAGYEEVIPPLLV